MELILIGKTINNIREPAEEGYSTTTWGDIINSFHNYMSNTDRKCNRLSAAVWSTGCMQPRDGDRYRGINIPGLVKYGSYLDWLNIMAYDCGSPADIDPIGCFYTYRVYFSKPLVLGFEPGKMGWGDYFTKQEDVVKGMKYAANDGAGNGYFIWAYYKDDFANGVTRDYIVEEGRKAWENKVEVIVELPGTESNSFRVACPNCKKVLVGELKLV